MSLSINTSNKNYYELLYNEKLAAEAATRSKANSEATNSDTVQFSQVALQYFNQGTPSTEEDLYTNTYSPNKVEAPLTPVEVRSLLSNIQEGLQSADTDTTNDSRISSIEELLKDIDISAATDDEILTLFSQVKQSFQPYMDEAFSDEEIGKGGPPPRHKAMNGLVPPFVPGLEDTAIIEPNASPTEKDLTIEDLRTILSDLQSQLSIIDVEDDSTEDGNNVWNSFQELLSDTDITLASDDDIATLFDKWIEVVEQSQQQR